ncbi:transcriptional regulator [Enterobacter cancerogenus]|uniref:winged helix-turn-helix domain-containing protein n=1 Tax=Enterobacter cancerogenus TaxID=69218 RepID=UPI0037FA6152
MIFHIAGSILFNSLDGTIKTEYEHEVKLSLTATKLLLVLLDSGGEVCGREFLLTAVWDNEGLTGSNGKLNQYISILRKTFSEIGLSDFIITVPRIGFRLNNAVTVFREDNTIDLNVSSSSHYIKIKLVIYATIFLLLVFTFLLMFYKKPSEGKQESVIYKRCNINYLSQFNKEEVDKLNPIIFRILTRKGLQCNSSTLIYFDHYSSVNVNDLGRSLISICQKGSDNRVVKCDNFYYFNLKGYE